MPETHVRYIGYFSRLTDCIVKKASGAQLDTRLDEVNGSPTGLSWGYAGSGPLQLSYAILRDFMKDKDEAGRLAQAFLREVGPLMPAPDDRPEVPKDCVTQAWTLTEGQVRKAIEAPQRNTN